MLHNVEIEFLPDVVNDLDVDFSADPKAAASYANDQRNLRKIREHTAKLKVDVVYPFREGKRLLVLDIDYSNCLSRVLFAVWLTLALFHF